MDYREFERHVADYVEGNLPSELRPQMDQARRQNLDLDELAHLHEQILNALVTTPEVTSPEYLSRRILAAAEEQDRALAREKTLFRKSLVLWLAAAAAVTAMVSALCYIFQDALVTSLGKISVAGGMPYGQKELVSAAVAELLKWPSIVCDLLIIPVSIPGTEFALRAVYILVIAALAFALWYCRELESL
jgi:hypothetical protein